MRISLIQPRWRIESDGLCDPLNLGYIAAFLRKKGYKNIQIYSAVFDSDKNIIANASCSDVVGITAASSMMPHVNFLVDKIKEKNPKTVIVLGGVHPSALPEESLKNRNINYVVRREGEITFYELIKAIEGKINLDEIDGTSFYKNGKIHHVKNRMLIQDLDTIPFPARDLMVQESFIRRYYRVCGKRCTAILTSRGCPYNCSCCASGAVWDGKWRARSPNNVIEEIKQVISKYHIEEVHFEDANFAINKQRVIDLCNMIMNNKLNISWHCLIYPDAIDKEVLKVMKQSGCKTICVGVESGSDKILENYGKPNTIIGRVKYIFNAAKELDICTIAFFILGLPAESHDTINQTKKLIRNIKPDFATCSILVPFPGSRYYQLAKEKGYIRSNFDLSRLYYTRVYMPTDNLTRKELEKEYKELLGSFSCFWRRRKFGFWPIYYNLKKELINNTIREYGYLSFRIVKHLMLKIFNPLYRISDL